MLKALSMLVFTSLIALGIVMFQFSAPLQLGAVASYTQNLCVSSLPESRYFDLYAAILCDQKISDPHLRADFARTALLHLLVASGTHLILLERFIEALSARSKSARFLTVPLLCTFAFATGLSAPFVRVLFVRLYVFVQKRYRLGWSPLQILLLSGFSALLINFSLHRGGAGLLSLVLSWIAGTAYLCVKPADASRLGLVNRFHLQLAMYSLMIPALLPLAVPHPISIFWNLLLAPVLSIVLFPLALIGAVTPHLIRMGIDAVFALLIKLLHVIASFTPDGLEKYRLPIVWPWLYLFCLTLAAIYLQRRDRLRKLTAPDLPEVQD